MNFIEFRWPAIFLKLKCILTHSGILSKKNLLPHLAGDFHYLKKLNPFYSS